MIYIGIDPGLNGAVGVLNCVGTASTLDHIKMFDTPTLTVSGAKEKREYSTAAMALLLEPYVTQVGDSVLVVLENVHSMPKQGVASSFSFGKGFGMWQGIIAAYKLPMELVSPQRWKKEILVDMGQDKDASRFKAIALFPSIAEQLSRKKDDGRAEALLLAEYGRRIRKGQL
jgi:crossover junction endodeoxyribonuclease RuvC